MILETEREDIIMDTIVVGKIDNNDQLSINPQVLSYQEIGEEICDIV